LGKQPGAIGQTTRRYWANNQAILGKQPASLPKMDLHAIQQLFNTNQGHLAS
jgi:hypothetical protein